MSTHSIISPAILYWGTPVALITTLNPSSPNSPPTSNIAPISSHWYLGHSCILGLDASSHTTTNLLRTRSCVLNLPDEPLLPAVNALALTTGSNPVSASKQSRNYTHVSDKWTRAGLTPQKSDFVQPERIRECPVQMECELVQTMEMRPDLADRKGLLLAVEVRVLRVHVREELRMEGFENRVDPGKWRPIIMNFQEFYSLSGRIGESVLGRTPEEKYRALTKSDVTKLPGDDDDVLAATQESVQDTETR